MVQGKYTIPLTIIGFSALIIILAIIGINFFTQGTAVGCTGGTITSMGQAQFLSNDPTVGGQAWLLNLVENGGCQYATGTIDNSQITASGKTAVNDLTVTISSSPQVCKYPINARTEQIYSVAVKSVGNIVGLNKDAQCNSKCANIGYYGYFGGDGFPSTLVCDGLQISCNCYCYDETAIATVGDVGDSTLQFSTDIIATIAGTQYKGTVSNVGTTSVNLGTVANVQWSGNLVSGSNCPTATAKNVLGAYANGWKFIDVGAYSTYKNYRETGFKPCIDYYLRGMSGYTPESCASSYNSKANSALVSKQFTADGGETATQSGTITNGQASITLGKAVQFPQFTMRIKASTLGIYVPVSIPAIISATSDCFNTGSTGNIAVQIKNQGTVSGSIVTSISCSSGFSLTGTSTTSQVGAGQTTTVNFPITGQTNQVQTQGTCTITAQDKENPSNSATKTVGVCVKGIQICNPNEIKCIGVDKKQCNSAGTGWGLLSTNDASCQICVQNPNDPSCIVVPPKPPTNTSSWIFTIASLLSALVAFFLINPNIKIENKAGKYIVVILLAVIVGIIFGTIISLLAGLAIQAYNFVKGLIP